jgi:hypothetical protein
MIQLPDLGDNYYLEEDFRNLYWVHKYVDPELFSNDTVIGYQIAQYDIGFTTIVFHKLSPLFSIPFALTAPFISPTLLSKLFIFPLILIANYYLFKIGSNNANPKSAAHLCILFSVLILTGGDGFSVANGVQRSFAIPLLLMLVHFLIQKQYGKSAIVVFLS